MEEKREFEMEKVFQPQQMEGRIYEMWESSGAFAPVKDPNKKPFTIVMPPPNITGQLHIGHALDEMPQDVLIRYHRMKGDPTLWVPGTDHAAHRDRGQGGRRAEGRGPDQGGHRSREVPRARVGMEEGIRRPHRPTAAQTGRLLRLVARALHHGRGSLSRAVRETFVNLYEKGLHLPRRAHHQLVPRPARPRFPTRKWSTSSRIPTSGTSAIPVRTATNVVVATTRPETHAGRHRRVRQPQGRALSRTWWARRVTLPHREPGDPRRRRRLRRHGVRHRRGEDHARARPQRLRGRPAPQPAAVIRVHERRRHDERKRAASTRAWTATKLPRGHRGGAERARRCWSRSSRSRTTSGTCYRCHDHGRAASSPSPVVREDGAAGRSPRSRWSRTESSRFIPERFEKIYFNWMENIRDWCISRQLWWGHRIPAFYCDDCGEIIVSRRGHDRLPQVRLRTCIRMRTCWTPGSPRRCGRSPRSAGRRRPRISTISIRPTRSSLRLRHHLLLGRAHDLLRHRAHGRSARSTTVLMHGLVRDAQGRKMSKSLGNGIDPLEVIDKYGADALRFSLVTGIAPGNDMRFSRGEDRSAAATSPTRSGTPARFVLMNLEGFEPEGRARRGQA